MDLTVRVRRSRYGTVVLVGGDLDVETDESFQAILLDVMRSYSPRLLLDLTSVTFMDCAGLRALVLTRRRAETRKGSVRLVAASPVVRRVIAMTRMTDSFPITVSRVTVPSVRPNGFRLIADLGTVYP
ncbi:MAG: STAS domain-containing protein [Trebonia sp.]